MKILSLVVMIVILFLSACKKEEPEESSGTFASCCEIDPMRIELGEGKVYVPNVFTPDQNGINDFFIPIANDEIEEFESFAILRPSGETIYEATNVLVSSGIEFAWNGRPDQEVLVGTNGQVFVYPGDEDVLRGVFDYIFTVRNIAGETITIEGEICSFPCRDDDPKESTPTYISNCAFAAQSDYNGGFDSGLPNGEFWDCIE